MLAFALAPASALAQSFDTSGDGLVNGSWFVRYVAYDNLTSAGTIGRARAITGTFAFNGTGSYTLTGQLIDNTVNSGTPQSVSVTGSYGVSSSGLLELQNPLDNTQYLYGGVGASALVGSSPFGSSLTTLVDMMVAVPAAASVSNSSLQGPYWVGSLDYPGGDGTHPINALFEINADGQGNLGTLSVAGHSVALGNSDTTQSVSGATYSLSGSSGTLTFPSATNQFISGAKQFFISSDGNVLVGGSSTDYDMIVGIRAASGTVGNATFNGIYYSAGEDADVSQASTNSYYVDAYYGSLHANGAGTSIAHQLINPSDGLYYDYTADDEFTVGSNGGVLEDYDRYYVGANGNAVILIGRSTTYSLELNITAMIANPTGTVVLNPLGIANAANYAPITNPIAPGEYIDLFGTGFASSSQQASSVPFPASLGGVSVSINGVAAPIYTVSPTEIVCLVPFELTQSYATIQVSNNGATSNAVTVYTEDSAPGAFTLGQDGIGPGAFLHANGAVVSDSSPAAVGEVIEAFLTGLGPVSPGIADGAAASANPLSYTSDQYYVYVDGTQSPNVTYEGLAPGFVGLYQVNFVVPSTPDTGDVYVDFEDSVAGGYTSMATMAVSNVNAAIANPALKKGHRNDRIRHKESVCRESFDITSGSPTVGRCASAGKTSRDDLNSRRQSAGISPSGE
jgi:uncharacterized protein (TIGR03437 family)